MLVAVKSWVKQWLNSLLLPLHLAVVCIFLLIQDFCVVKKEMTMGNKLVYAQAVDSIH